MKSLALGSLLLLAGHATPAAPPAPIGHHGGTPAVASTTGPLVFGTGDVVLRGTISRELREYSDNRPFVLTADNHVVLSLRRYQGEDTDAPLVLGASLTLPSGQLDLPRAYELRGAALPPDETLLIDLRFEAGGTARPLALISEYRNELDPGATQLDILVSGLEPCDAPNAGGFCG